VTIQRWGWKKHRIAQQKESKKDGIHNDQINGQLTSKQRTANGQATTNNNCKNSNNWNKRERAHSQNENECNESIPDQTEVIDHGKGGAAIPEWYCKHYHEQKEIRRTWLNGHGKLINWRREIVAWFNKDGKPLRENEHAKSNRGGGHSFPATARVHPASQAWPMSNNWVKPL
jgi:hypothetical protein